MAVVGAWTGRTACVLQAALRLSNESFAEHLGVSVRTVSGWHQKPTTTPKPEMQQLLDTALERASAAVKARFAQAVSAPDPAGVDAGAREPEDAEHGRAIAEAERRLGADPNIGAALEWLDRHAGWRPGTARRDVASRLAVLNPRALEDRGAYRGRVDQRQVAQALADYYRGGLPDHGRYSVHYDRSRTASTSVLTRAAWLDLACPLVPGHDRLALVNLAPDGAVAPDERTASLAAQRLAETLIADTRLIDMPLYRLLTADVGRGAIDGTMGVSRFVHYALTMDLLEGELLDALAANADHTPGSLPLRDKYLPDLASVVDTSNRLCAGGVLALCAIARPAGMHDNADYLLLIQQRSGHVLNAAQRLAVIPKGFHQPMTDYRGDARIGATLLREMEEELFGRNDVDNTVTDQRSADPMHPTRLSGPMRWLAENTKAGAFRLECTGFGLNLVSGNFEFASLIVIEDEEFWSRFGGQVEANWESSSLRLHSSLDRELLTELIGDTRWSNEGLFALLQGLRRLGEIGGRRVGLPAIDWELLQP